MITRRLFIQKAMLSISLSAVNIEAIGRNKSQAKLLPFPSDLADAAQQAFRANEPFVVMASLPGCPWCELLRRNYLGPMRSEGVAAYEFMVNERGRTLQNFQGQRIAPAALSSDLKITITPTLLFLGRDGQEIAPRIEGVASADFIGALLDERLSIVRERLKSAR
jgi:thioredoxin-related protein